MINERIHPTSDHLIARSTSIGRFSQGICVPRPRNNRREHGSNEFQVRNVAPEDWSVSGSCVDKSAHAMEVQFLPESIGEW